MRFYLALFISTLMLLSQPSWATPGYQIDQQATAQAQWKPGEVVAEGYSGIYWAHIFGPRLYRKFIGITDQGYAVVQDFYADSDNKFSDPFVVMQPDRIGDIELLKEETDKSSSGFLDGKLTIWYENGPKASEGYYQDGKRQGLWTIWYENGQKWRESHYHDGILQGLWTFWDKYRQKMFEGNYQDGERQGFWTMWHLNGRKMGEGNFQNGKMQGVWTDWWHTNGQKKSEGYLEDGKPQGLWTAWHSNGQKWSEGYLEDGKQQGLWLEWDEDGQRISETLYEAGEVVSETKF